MVPLTFVFLNALPLTPNGKLDRKALPAPDHSSAARDDVFAAPRTPVEALLADIWAEVLKLDKVGIHDNFFHLGGHSLLATQVISRIRQSFSIDVALREFFETPNDCGARATGAKPLLQERGFRSTIHFSHCTRTL